MKFSEEVIMEKIAEIIQNELGLEVAIVIEEESTLAALGVDSIALMSLIVYLEDYFDCEIDLTAKETFEYGQLTVRSLVEKIKALKGSV